MILVGAEVKAGSFEDGKGRTIDYNNLLLYFLSDEIESASFHFGQSVNTEKVKNTPENLAGIFKGIYKKDGPWLSEYMGHHCELIYDKSGKLVKCLFD